MVTYCDVALYLFLCECLAFIKTTHFMFSVLCVCVRARVCRSLWPHGLKCGSVAACFWVRGFEPRRGHECLSHVSFVCCQVEVSATARSLVQGRLTKCGVSECDRKASVIRRP